MDTVETLDTLASGTLDIPVDPNQTTERPATLEAALSRTEADVEAALKAATAAAGATKKVLAAAKAGDLREFRKGLDATEQAIMQAKQLLARARTSWEFDAEAHLASGAYRKELLATAEQAGVKIFEQDERLFCYPFLLRVSPGEQAVFIDKKRERKLRPSVLVKHLKDLQNKPVRFKPEAFLALLFEQYSKLIKQGGEAAGPGSVVKLYDIYEALTPMPSQAKDYSAQEFARDIYLLDQSRVTVTQGFTASFPASTATKVAKQTLVVVTKDGQEKRYYGLAFTPPRTD
jgi:hypothetical protein